jgi:coenzyme F420-reducing hydrogenase delta subunit
MKSILTILTAFVLLVLSFTFSSCKDCGKKENKPADRNGDTKGGDTDIATLTTLEDEDKIKVVKKLVLEVQVAQHMAWDAMSETIDAAMNGENIKTQEELGATIAGSRMAQTRALEVKNAVKKLGISGNLVAIALVAQADYMAEDAVFNVIIGQANVHTEIAVRREKVRSWLNRNWVERWRHTIDAAQAQREGELEMTLWGTIALARHVMTARTMELPDDAAQAQREGELDASDVEAILMSTDGDKRIVSENKRVSELERKMNEAQAAAQVADPSLATKYLKD